MDTTGWIVQDPVAAFFETHEQMVAPGVRAVVVDEGPDPVTIMWVRAEHPGAGDVARWLDTMPTNRKVKVIAVSSDRLAEMLERRGFNRCKVLSPSGDLWIDAHVRPANQPTRGT